MNEVNSLQKLHIQTPIVTWQLRMKAQVNLIGFTNQKSSMTFANADFLPGLLLSPLYSLLIHINNAEMLIASDITQRAGVSLMIHGRGKANARSV